MNRIEFKQLLVKRPLLLDGAMGTALQAHGAPLDVAFDALNVKSPELVAAVHRDYIEAGADVIETNSFGANRFKLAEHGLQDEVVQINKTAVSIARAAIFAQSRAVLLAGSIGPLGVRLTPLGRVTADEATAAFREQANGLLMAGVDLIIIETISDMEEMTAAVTAVRSLDTNIALVAQISFTRDDRTVTGESADVVARKLAALDADVIGVNCSGGPAQVLRLLSTIHQIVPDAILSAAPNAGWPEQGAQGRLLYPAIPDYFAGYARSFLAVGARLVGGCCGTTAVHIAAMRRAMDDPDSAMRPLPMVRLVTRKEKKTAVVDPPTKLHEYLENGRFVATVEMGPPKGIATHRLIEGARTLQAAGANFLDIADAPLARMRMSAWAAAYLVQKELGMETILHFPTRGRNLLRVQGDLLAAHAMGIRNLFVTMGDPTRIGDYPEATDSYDIVPTGLIHLIKQQFNSGLDKAGGSLDQATNFVAGCALSLTPTNPARELRLLGKKISNGADFALTQPVFEVDKAIAFIDRCQSEFGDEMLPLLVGIKPLYNGRNAEFLHHEVPGISIPADQQRRMHAAKHPQQEGVQIARETLGKIRPFVQGTYLMPAFSRYDLIADLLDGLEMESGRDEGRRG